MPEPQTNPERDWKTTAVIEAAKQGPSFVVLLIMLIGGGFAVYFLGPPSLAAVNRQSDVIETLGSDFKKIGVEINTNLEKQNQNMERQNQSLERQNKILESVKAGQDQTRKDLVIEQQKTRKEIVSELKDPGL